VPDYPGRLDAALLDLAAKIDLTKAFRPRGVVVRVGDGIAICSRLADVGFEELLIFDSGALGLAYDLRAEETGVVLLAGGDQVRAGEGVRGTQRLPELPVGPAALGRVIDPLGSPLDEGPSLDGRRLPLFRRALETLERKRVDESLWTGILALDAAIPIGRGQRELIIGDRNVGKSSLALDIVAAQTPGDVACVYVVIGQPMSRVLALRDALAHAGRLENTAIVAADASAAPGLQYLAPYAGAALAESFRDAGQHALVVYDDLTKHADAYRELALLLERPPGREAYPGDIFYIHAELLERAAPRRVELGGGSVTALPIVETSDGDISAYIPTNLISITDGQIYLDAGRFDRDQRPAIDIGRSVSRIGGVAQPPALRQAARNLRIELARFESLEKLARAGLDIDEATQSALARGNLLRELLRQNRLAPRSLFDQVAILTALNQGWLDSVPFGLARRVMEDALQTLRDSAAAGGLQQAEWKESLQNLISQRRTQLDKRDHET
jgi:F-type H+-transporting ATPase subunit alpha